MNSLSKQKYRTDTHEEIRRGNLGIQMAHTTVKTARKNMINKNSFPVRRRNYQYNKYQEKIILRVKSSQRKMEKKDTNISTFTSVI